MESSGTVFIIDDDPVVLQSLRWLIESVDLKVEIFTEAKEFLQNYHCDEPHCLVLDVRMPVMTGIELQELLLKQNINIPIIFITGHGDIPLAVKAIKNGALEFITKPINNQLLVEMVENAIEKSQQWISKGKSVDSLKKRISKLTSREHDVFELLIECLPTKIIAEKLGISPNTAELHRSKVMKKMESRSAATLIRDLLIHEVI